MPLDTEQTTGLQSASSCNGEINDCCRALIDSAQECIWTLDRQGRFYYINHTAQDLLGYHAEDLTGNEFLLYVPQSGQEAMRTLLNSVLAGNTRRYEMEILDSNGHIRTLSCKSAPWWVHGAMAGVVSYALDITPQRAVEAALELSENRYRNIVEEGREVHLRFKPDGTLTFVNRSWVEPLARNRTDLLGQNYAGLLPQQQFERVETAMAELNPAQPHVSFSLELPGENGRPSYYNCTIQAIYSNNGEEPRLLEYQVIGRDETTLRTAEQGREEANARLRKAAIQTIQSLFLTIEKKDPYTADHQRRTAYLSAEIAYALQLPRETVQGIYFGALIHDIGKLFIPVDILNRPGRISDIEYTLIKTHPQVGYEIIRDIDLPWNIADMILQHHEHLDGSGYPHQLRGEDICQGARIICVADVVESIASNRPYRPKLELINAIDEIIRYRGVYYDEEIVDTCLHLIENHRIDLNHLESNSMFN